MSPIEFDVPLRKKGFKSRKEIEGREKEILELFADEKEEKTYWELFKKLKEPKNWGKSTLWRYLERMVKERKLIRKGEGRGAIYRCNLVELMELDHFAYLDKIRQACSQQKLHSFYDMGAVNCSILGVPSEDLTNYEGLVAEAIVGKLRSSWLLLYALRGNFSLHLFSKDEVKDIYTMLSLYQHEFNEILSNILEHPKMSTNPKMVKEFFDHLRKSIVSWTEKTEIPCSFESFNSLIEQYDLEKADRHVHYPSLTYEREDVQLYGEELVAMTVTGNMIESQEFSQRIENWLKLYLSHFFETARKFKFNKVQEIGEVILEIFKTISQRRWHLQPKDPFTLKKEEKERLLNWKLLIDRYGEETTKFILNLVEEATSRYAERKDEFDVQDWIRENTHSHLKEKGVINLYAKEHFWS